MDLYGAEAAGAKPVLVFIHGGGWRIGDKATAGAGADKARVFTDAGYLYASLNHRLSPEVRHPAHVEDVAAGIAAILHQADAIGADPGRVVLMGHSAGAHLAALVAFDPRWLGAAGIGIDQLRGVILLDGAGYDLTRQAPIAIARGGFTGQMYADAFGTERAGWIDASPTLQIPLEAVRRAPALLLHVGRPDGRNQAEALARALRQAGGEAHVSAIAGRTHASLNRRFGEPGDPAAAAVFAALARWGLPTAAPA
jgi:acetyl esterase/lipase